MRRVTLMLLTVLVAGGGALRAQTAAPSAIPSFEVASVKPNTSGSTGSSGRTFKGAATFINVQARMLIVNAYGVRPNRVVGGPSWLDVERFDVNARAPEGIPDSQLSIMLRSLLAERFKLVARMETREEPVYALVLAREDRRLGPNLRPATDCAKGAVAAGTSLAIPIIEATQQVPCGTRSSSDSRGSVMQGGARTMGDLARALNGTGDREVIDRTGLSGTYDFDLRFARSTLASTPDADANLPTVFTAVQEQLGLKLESQRGPVEYLVIDSVERPSPD